MSLRVAIGVGLLAAFFLGLFLWGRRTTKRTEEQIRERGFEIARPVPEHLTTLIRQLAADTESLSGMLWPLQDSVITKDIEGTEFSLFEIPQHRDSRRFWIWIWICECSVQTRPYLVTHENSVIRRITNNWRLRSVDGPWVARTSVDLTCEDADIIERVHAAIIARPKTSGSACSALINNGAIAIIFEEFDIIDDLHLVDIIADLRRHVIAVSGIEDRRRINRVD